MNPMKRKLLSLMLCAALLCACLPALAEGGDVTVIDMTGREITLEGPAERIVALTAADCEILYALGAGDLLVGRGEWCDYPAEVLEVESVESGYSLNVEQLIALEPDVVFMTVMGQTEEQLQQIENAGITVVMTDGQDIEGTYEEIALVGEVVGKRLEAAAIVTQMMADFAALAENAADLEGKTVYFETSPLVWGLYSAGPGTFMDEIASMLGLTNIFGDVEYAWPSVSEEQVIERNPDYIVTITMFDSLGEDPIAEIMNREGWQDVTAVRNGAILNLVGNELSRPAPRLVEGAKLLYDFVTGAAADEAA